MNVATVCLLLPLCVSGVFLVGCNGLIRREVVVDTTTINVLDKNNARLCDIVVDPGGSAECSGSRGTLVRGVAIDFANVDCHRGLSRFFWEQYSNGSNSITMTFVDSTGVVLENNDLNGNGTWDMMDVIQEKGQVIRRIRIAEEKWVCFGKFEKVEDGRPVGFIIAPEIERSGFKFDVSKDRFVIGGSEGQMSVVP